MSKYLNMEESCAIIIFLETYKYKIINLEIDKQCDFLCWHKCIITLDDNTKYYIQIKGNIIIEKYYRFLNVEQRKHFQSPYLLNYLYKLCSPKVDDSDITGLDRDYL